MKTLANAIPLERKSGLSYAHRKTVKKKDLLILFAKSPYAPHVKTRLAPLLSDKERAQLQKGLILDTLSLTASLRLTRVLACAPDRKDRFFARCEKEHSVSLIKQEGADLGERMKNGFCWGFSHGFQKVVLIGTDAPTLPSLFIQEAFHRLKKFPIVLGPALDGGYYLIGAKPPVPDIFSRIKWGENTVLSETIKRLNPSHLFYLLPFWYDTDRPEDLTFLKWHLPILRRQGKALPVETGKVLKRHKGSDFYQWL